MFIEQSSYAQGRYLNIDILLIKILINNTF